MKKTNLLLLAIIAIITVSCTNDTNPEGETIQKTSVAFGIEQPTKTTSKQIKRGVIPVWVNTITIKAQSVVYPTYSVTENYTFDQQNGASIISMDNVALGSNVFTVNTTTDSPQFYQLTNLTVNTGTIEDKFDTALDAIDNEQPYVLYNGTVTASVYESLMNSISIPVTTLNGRLLSVFQLNQALKDGGYQAKITANYSILSADALNNITKGNELSTFKWSNTNSIQGKTITYKIEVSKINNQSVILKSYTATQDIASSTSISCYYLITDDGIILKKSTELGLDLKFPEWKNEHCTTCKDAK